MSKICILSAVNIKHMSMISLYTDRLLRDGIDFDIIYMDKYGQPEDFPAKNIFVFKNVIDHSLPKWRKVLLYWKFKKYAINIIKNNNYDFIIVWNDVAIFMFADYLRRKWAGKYCLNIRDYCGEKHYIVFKRFQRVIEKSAFSTTSSLGYKKFLPDYNYIQVHSMNMKVLSNVNPRTSLKGIGEPICIGFVGYVRFFDINKKLLEIFKNDPRFELHFYGSHANVLQQYAKDNGILNTAFHDSFPVSDTAMFLNKIDVVNNVYGNNTISLDYALSIKLYHGVYSKIPILVCPNTYMEEISNQFKIGFTVSEYTSKMKEDFYQWYRNLNFEEFNASCEKFISQANIENQEFENAYTKFLKNN